MFSVVDGNLLGAKEDYICHQTNCLSDGGAAGLAYSLFNRFPWADCYMDRKEPSKPGTIDVRVREVYLDFPRWKIVNMHGQFYPGGPHHGSVDTSDGQRARLKYFRNCLITMSMELPKDSSYAFPWLIGCGIGGGDWGKYITMLKGFEEYIEGDVRLYRLRSA